MHATRAVLLAAAALLPLGASGQAARKTKPQEVRNADLFIAIRNGDTQAMRAALDSGANPNSRNWLNITPLHWAAMNGSLEMTQLLIRKGAKVDDPSIYGTAVTFAAQRGAVDVARMLLDRGARVEAPRVDDATPLMVAAAGGSTALVKLLLERKASPTRRDNEGATPLHYAARRGRVEAIRLLLAAGATVDARDNGKQTPLMAAAAGGHAGAIDLLLQSGADVNASDSRGATALHLAARCNGDPAVVARLIRAGADASLRDATGNTPAMLAAVRGFRDAHEAMGQKAGASLAPVAAAHPAAAGDAVTRGVQAIQTGLKTFQERARCVSCHHQGLGLTALARAGRAGVPVDQKLVDAYLSQIAEEGKATAPLVHKALTDSDAAKLVPAVDIEDLPTFVGYVFGALHASQVPANPGLVEMAVFLARQQKADGHWSRGLSRGHMQNSPVTATALALEVIAAYRPESHRAEMDKRIARARKWLVAQTPRNAEEMAARLMGLRAAGAPPDVIVRAAEALKAAQLPDGAWAGTFTRRGDAHVTGMSLYSLRTAGGVPAGDPAIQKGAAWLVRMQDESGAWHAAKHTVAYNNHFDAGFPNGYDQYASLGATSWAVMALLESMPQRSAAAP